MTADNRSKWHSGWPGTSWCPATSRQTSRPPSPPPWRPLPRPLSPSPCPRRSSLKSPFYWCAPAGNHQSSLPPSISWRARGCDGWTEPRRRGMPPWRANCPGRRRWCHEPRRPAVRWSPMAGFHSLSAGIKWKLWGKMRWIKSFFG